MMALAGVEPETLVVSLKKTRNAKTLTSGCAAL